MNGEVRLEMNGDSIQRVSSPENGRTLQMASSPDEKGHTLQMTPEESGDSVQMIPESNMQDHLHLPRRSYPALRVPWFLLIVEATGLCRCFGRRKVRRRTYQMLVLVMTFFTYVTYYMTRRTLSAVKSFLDPTDCLNATNSSGSFNSSLPREDLTSSYLSNLTESCPPGWAPFNGPDGKTFLGILDYTFVFFYAVATYISGAIADRTPLRYFLAVGMFGCVLANVLFGVGFWGNIHFLGYFIVVQIFGGVMHSTGWPGVVAVMSNWFGKGNRGFVMGLWTCHYSVGNIAGLLVAAYYAGYGWGWAFLSTAIVMMIITILIFLLLPSEPTVVGLAPAKTDQNQKKVKRGERKIEKLEREQAEDKEKQQPNAVGFFRALLIPSFRSRTLSQPGLLFSLTLVEYLEMLALDCSQTFYMSEPYQLLDL